MVIKFFICFSLKEALIFSFAAHHEYKEKCIMLTYVYKQHKL